MTTKIKFAKHILSQNQHTKFYQSQSVFLEMRNADGQIRPPHYVLNSCVILCKAIKNPSRHIYKIPGSYFRHKIQDRSLEFHMQ
jgi:hypothetical protein